MNRSRVKLEDANAQEQFARDGYIAPITVLGTFHCKMVMAHLQSATTVRTVEWAKAAAISDRLIYEIATLPSLVQMLRGLIGNDIILWGAAVPVRPPNISHPWHSDLESSAPEGGFVSVWIGLENIYETSSLRLVTRSHRFGRTIQEHQARHGFRRGEVDDETIAKWAHDYDAETEIVQPKIENGQAIVFDGRLWHGSKNINQRKTRTALLLQYVQGKTPVYIPDPAKLEWPTQKFVNYRPPVLCISGKASRKANRIVSPPRRGQRGQLVDTFTRVLELPLDSDKQTGWRPHIMFQGATPSLEHITCHVSVLEPKCSPHSPHAHIEEEILIVLHGEAEIILASSANDVSPRREKFKAGDFVFHPAFQHHTIRNVSDKPVTYLMFKWRSSLQETKEILGAKTFSIGSYDLPVDLRRINWQVLFKEPTCFLSCLQAHITDLQSGAGYEPHSDEYDVGIVLLSGQITTVNDTLTAPAVAFFPRGQLHDMHNPGKQIARYVVFEFHRKDELMANDEHCSSTDVVMAREGVDNLRAENRTKRANDDFEEMHQSSFFEKASWRRNVSLRSLAKLFDLSKK